MQLTRRSMVFAAGLAVLVPVSAPAARADKISLTLTAPNKGICTVNIHGVVPVELAWRYFYVSGRFDYAVSGKAQSQDFAERFKLYKNRKRLKKVFRQVAAWVPSCRSVRMIITDVGCKPPDGPSVPCLDDVVIRNRTGLRVSIGR